MKRVWNYMATTCKHAFLILWGVIAFVPFLWVTISAFKDNQAIFTTPFSLPASWSVENFAEAWEGAKVGVYFVNSIVIAIITMAAQILVVAMATYALTRLMRANRLASFFSIGLMIPIHAMLIPNFLTIRNLGLMNTRTGIILVYMAANISFGVFLLSGFMQGIPRELDEAAMIDGAGYLRVFFSVLLPVCKPGLATVGTFGFLNAWNEFLFASVLLTKQENMTLTEGINYLKGQYVTDYGLLCAGLLFAIVPVVIMYILLQEQVVKGMTAGAVKG